jgi:hypothetical protein
MLGVGSAGAGATVEQANPNIPISAARTTGNFIPNTHSFRTFSKSA